MVPRPHHSTYRHQDHVDHEVRAGYLSVTPARRRRAGRSVTTMRRPSVRSHPRLANDPMAWLTLWREPPAISASWLWFSSIVTMGAAESPARRTSVFATRPGRS